MMLSPSPPQWKSQKQRSNRVQHNATSMFCKFPEAYMITSSPVGSPCVRNVFVIERADPKDGLGPSTRYIAGPCILCQQGCIRSSVRFRG